MPYTFPVGKKKPKQQQTETKNPTTTTTKNPTKNPQNNYNTWKFLFLIGFTPYTL